MSLIFRQMTLDDVSTVHQLEVEVEQTPWSEENFASSIKDGYNAFVGIENEQIVSWCVVMPAYDVCELLIIGVKDKLRGRGLGRLTLEKALNEAKTAGFSAMLLEVRQSNTVAISLYEKSGFEVVGMRKNYYLKADGRENAVLMTRTF